MEYIKSTKPLELIAAIKPIMDKPEIAEAIDKYAPISTSIVCEYLNDSTDSAFLTEARCSSNSCSFRFRIDRPNTRLGIVSCR